MMVFGTFCPTTVGLLELVHKIAKKCCGRANAFSVFDTGEFSVFSVQFSVKAGEHFSTETLLPCSILFLKTEN
jgi:hypothetical protein